MNTPSTPSQTSAFGPNEKRRLLVASSCFILALITYGGWFYLQHRASAQNALSHKTHLIPEEPIAGLEEAQLAKIQWLRGKWQLWAQSHQTEIRAMLHSKGEDKTAFNVVWNALPAHASTSELGFGPADLLPPDYKTVPHTQWVDRGEAVLSWAPIGKLGAHPQDGAMASRIQRDNEAGVQKDFAALHDIHLSTALGGFKQITLWVSGRITTKEAVLNSNLSPGQKVWKEGSYIEIEPPYDFLSKESS